MPWGLIILLLTGLAVGWAWLTAYTAAMLARPPRRTYAWAVSRSLPGDPGEAVAAGRGLEFTRWTVRSRGAELPVWDVQGLDPRGPTLVLVHGWGDSRVTMLGRVVALAAHCSRIVVPDLPGHGVAPRRARFTLGLREPEDVAAVGAAARGGNPDTRVVLFGYSLGAGACVAAACLMAEGGGAPVAVIAEAPYRVPATPARNVLRLRGMPSAPTLRPALALLGVRFGAGLSWALRPDAGGFDRAAWAARLPPSTPLLVLHGDRDAVCPPEDGRAIAAAAPRGRLIAVTGGEHQTLWSDPATADTAAEAVRGFLAEIGVRPDVSAAAGGRPPATRPPGVHA